MISKNVENMIPKIQQFFGSQPIKKAWLFGSCSRGEESMDSDVDILVEYDRQNSRVSLMKIAAMMLNLEDLLHRKVDMVEASRLLSFALDSVNNDKFLIYERKS
ncbi:nucleotidyltransferase family protein [Segatella copri]|uniref:nucleotidyltransferase family protein n=1 Tax=Segatella copri TaxID=165179 RepID=UPI003D080733